MRRKLLVVEVPEGDIDYLIGKLDIEAHCIVHELPSAEELGRVATEADANFHWNASRGYRQITVGQAVLGALTKRTGGGDAK